MLASNGMVVMTEDMTLEQKLAAIDEAIANNQTFPVMAGGEFVAPVDPASLVMCTGCQ